MTLPAVDPRSIVPPPDLAGLKPAADARPVDVVSTRHGYDRWAEIYDAEDNALIMLEEQQVGRLLGDVAGLDLLDVGCGTGRHAARLAGRGARVTAMDFSDGMVAKARAKPGWERVRFLAHDLAQPLPLADRSFDVVLCALVIDHIHALDPLFREFNRVCRADGRVVVTSMHPAMLLRGIEAHFTDPATGREIHPQSAPNRICDYVMAAARADLRIVDMGEYAMSADLAGGSARATKYIGWPLLLTMVMRPGSRT